MKPHELAYQYVESRTRFRHQGRTIHGADCAGLVILVAREMGLEVSEPKAYSREPSGGLLRKWLLANGCRVVDRDPQVDDIVLLQLRGQKEEGHMAIVAPHPEGLGLIHSYFSARRCIYQGLDAHRRNEITGVLEWPVKD